MAGKAQGQGDSQRSMEWKERGSVCDHPWCVECTYLTLCTSPKTWAPVVVSVAMNAHGCVMVACGVCLCVGQGLPVVCMCVGEGVMVRAWFSSPPSCSHLALISGSLGREPWPGYRKNVPGSGHCAGPCSGSPAEIVPGGRGRVLR